jgi:uncharacterized protein YndB with AHSA1/START domain
MKTIQVQTYIKAPIPIVWEYWTLPQHIIHWNFASQEWHCPDAHNDFCQGGKFTWRMEAKNKTMGFDYKGTYLQIKEHEFIKKVLSDGRIVDIQFKEKENHTLITETFEPDRNAIELQRTGWQAILDNFKWYVENSLNGTPY